MRAAHQYLMYRDQEAAAKKLKDRANKAPGGGNLLKDYVAEHGEENSDGHLDFLFDEPLNIGGVRYRGLRNQKSQGAPLLDEDRAEVLLKNLNLRDRVAKEVTVVVWDWDELYVLNQQGLITDEQLDSLFDDPDPTWSLVVIK
jgi:hypothetical protein